MKLAMVADAFPPMRTSGAVQLRDLADEIIRQGHSLTVILPDSRGGRNWSLEEHGDLAVLRLRAPRTKDVSYFRRAIAEFRLSSSMFSNLKKSPVDYSTWEGIIWYSPSIFFGPLVHELKTASHCPAYLILRDLFPEWAVDMGLLKKGFIYNYFKSVEKGQYRQADTIGVQTSSNLDYFHKNHSGLNARIEVLNNWLAESRSGNCSIRIDETSLGGKTIFAYTGNIGIAQGMDILIDLADAFCGDERVGFIFVGRGTAVEQIKNRAAAQNLENILFYDEIDPDEIPGLLVQCHAGLVALDPRHSNDNIPGKFLAYMQAGLPVLANINAGNDLESLILKNETGLVVTDNSLVSLKEKADELLSEYVGNERVRANCRRLASETFSAETAVKQIINALSS